MSIEHPTREPSVLINMATPGTREGKLTIQHNGNPCRVVLRPNSITIGCSEITMEAVEHILKKHREIFGNTPKEYILQP